MSVGVHEAGHDDRVAGVHLHGVPRTESPADLGHHTPIDEDVGDGEVGSLRAQGEDAATAEQGPRRHAPPPRSTDLTVSSMRLPGSPPTPITPTVERAPLTVQGHYISCCGFARGTDLERRTRRRPAERG